MVVNREKHLQELANARHNGLVKIITGMRRCGKSFLLFRLFKRFLEDDGVMPDHIRMSILWQNGLFQKKRYDTDIHYSIIIRP